MLNLSLIKVIDKNIIIKKCKNCNQYFIPVNRSDEVYCNRVSPQNPNKTCKVYGANRTYKEQQKERPIDKAHIQTSQFLRMRYKRSKEKNQAILYKNKLDNYLADFKVKREQYKSGKLKETDFIKWIKKQKEL